MGEPYFSKTGFSTIATARQASFFPSRCHSSSMVSTVSLSARQRRHSQKHMAAHTRKRSRNIRPMATLDNLCKALAVSSMRLVSRSEHNSVLSWLAFDADSCDNRGTGSMVELNDAAISIRVSLISALSLLNGISMISFSLSLSSLRVGSVVLRRMRLSSKPVGIATFSRPLSAGMENSGMSMLMFIRFVKL